MLIAIGIEIWFNQEMGKHRWLIHKFCLKMELDISNEGKYMMAKWWIDSVLRQITLFCNISILSNFQLARLKHLYQC